MCTTCNNSATGCPCCTPDAPRELYECSVCLGKFEYLTNTHDGKMCDNCFKTYNMREELNLLREYLRELELTVALIELATESKMIGYLKELERLEASRKETKNKIVELMSK